MRCRDSRSTGSSINTQQHAAATNASTNTLALLCGSPSLSLNLLFWQFPTKRLCASQIWFILPLSGKQASKQQSINGSDPCASRAPFCLISARCLGPALSNSPSPAHTGTHAAHIHTHTDTHAQLLHFALHSLGWLSRAFIQLDPYLSSRDIANKLQFSSLFIADTVAPAPSPPFTSSLPFGIIIGFEHTARLSHKHIRSCRSSPTYIALHLRHSHSCTPSS